MDHPPPNALRLAVFGGSFDPIHMGHLTIARRAMERFDLERVLWIPAGRPPHKPDRALAPAHMRLAMTMMATVGTRGWDVWPGELERPGPSFTYDTLLEVPEIIAPRLTPKEEGGLARRRRELELFLIIGSDNLPGLPGWRNAEDVLALARPIVAWRGGDPEELLDSVRGRLSEAALARLRRGFMELPPIPFSSTKIRAALARGEAPVAELPPDVLSFIVEKGLYGWPEGAKMPDPLP
jgi:nicotinate-nucleotide adenylyltransferase